MTRLAVLALLLLAPGLARAQALPLPPPWVPPPEERGWGEAAPTPNRRIEAPSETLRPGADLQPSLAPTVIVPRETAVGSMLGQDHPGRREERLFQEPAPGLRLRVPFTD